MIFMLYEKAYATSYYSDQKPSNFSHRLATIHA